ncbi:GIN domain-containing protein [Alistipes indistinctus]|jgi:hypothetical protein|uniref:GIN domain-containing protein n=1 Tax=Alistipes indistinctus TaxID=626932 RepID=UPI00241D1CD5|nr:DUF2807 domain-containing protein [Alistipes indistinctus]
MKKIALMLLVLTCSLAASAQQSIVSKRLDAFRNIDLSGNLHVELIKADSAHIDVKLNGTNSNRLDWGIKNGTLSVHLRPGGEKGASGDVKIYYDTLSSLKISASNVSVQGTLTQGMIDVDMTAGAIFGADLQLKDICLKITGNSVANLTGSAKYGTLIATSKSKVNARLLTCQDVRVEATSGAEVYVKAVERIQIVANTGGAVYYQGEPEIFRSATKMMGTVNNIGK